MKKVIVKALKKVVSAATAFTLIFAGFTYNTNASAEGGLSYADKADQIVVLVNEAREEAGLAPLSAVPVMNEAASTRASEAIGLFSHTRPSGEYFNSILDSNGILYAMAGENLAAGYSTAEETFNQWKNSPGHWANIMKPEYTHIGVGVVYDANSDYEWYWTQLFVSIDGELEGQYTPERFNADNSRMVSAPIIYGDVDGNGTVNTFDLVLVLKALTTNTALSSTQIERADCLDDGKITLSDAIVIKKYILGQCNVLPMNI